ncbi:hypothetical protein NQZ68_005596 [Dissostichus eleginoides]|nr:hypothetical protein NQZ68_005596 [Dissostichus eleginoides]
MSSPWHPFPVLACCAFTFTKECGTKRIPMRKIHVGMQQQGNVILDDVQVWSPHLPPLSLKSQPVGRTVYWALLSVLTPRKKPSGSPLSDHC